MIKINCKPENVKTCTLKIWYLDLHAIETHFQLRKHCLKSSEKKCKMHQFLSPSNN